jgi:hypothetical protein
MTARQSLANRKSEPRDDGDGWLAKGYMKGALSFSIYSGSARLEPADGNPGFYDDAPGVPGPFVCSGLTGPKIARRLRNRRWSICLRAFMAASRRFLCAGSS